MDGGTEGHSTIWSRLSRLFGHDDQESLEKAILEARADGEVEPYEESMLLGILRFNDLQVQDTMIPRTDIDCVPDDMPLQEVARIIVRSGHSRIPVYKDTRDNIVGILHAKDVLSSLLDQGEHAPAVSRVMRLRQRRKVDLPQPEGPIRAVTLRGSKFRLTSCRALFCP